MEVQTSLVLPTKKKKRIKKKTAKAMMLIVNDKRNCDELNLTFKILDPS